MSIRSLPRDLLRGLVRFYQLAISPWTPPSCRYYPSCSQYALIALERHGALRGTWLAVRRLARCHPWTAGGVDDVPPARDAAVPQARGASPAPGATILKTAPGGPVVCHEHAERARSSAR